MTTIEIVSEPTPEETIYRAICGTQQATGTTPGQALDMILATQGNAGGTLVIVQRFVADDLFSAQQQARLRSLMDNFHHASAVGETISHQNQQELESLVEAEWQAAIERAKRIFPQIQTDES